MTVIDALLGCAAILLFIMPGVFLIFTLFPRSSLGESFFVGGALGWCLLTLLGRHVPFDYWYLTLMALYAVSGGLLFRFIMAAPEERTPRDFTGGLVWLVAFIAFFKVFLLSVVGDLPPGKYPMYHLILIKKILLEGAIPVDMTPISQISVHYPVGSHLVVAMVSKLTGMPPHYAFRSCFPAVFFMTGGVMYLLGMKIFRGQKAPAFFGSLIWAALAAWGGGIFVLKGDLPQLSSLFIFLAFLWLMVSDKSFAGRIVAGTLMAGILCSHYGTMVMAVGVALTVLIAEITMEGKAGDWSITCGVALIIGAALGLDSFLKGIEVLLVHEQNEIFNYREVFMPLARVLRAPDDFVLLMGALGFILIAVIPDGKTKILPLVWGAAVYFLLMLFGYLYRVIFFGYFGGFAALATPSNLVAVTAFPLSLAGGWYIAGREDGQSSYMLRLSSGLVVFVLYAVFRYFVEWQYLFGSAVPYLKDLVFVLIPFFLLAAIWTGENRNRAVVRGAGLVLLVALIGSISISQTVFNVNIARKIMVNREMVDFHAIKNTEAIPDDAFIVNKPVNPYDLTLYGWLPYWTWKECTYLVLPPTENRRGVNSYYRMRILPLDAYEVRVKAHIEGRAAAEIVPKDMGMSEVGFKTIYKSDHRRVNVYEPRDK